MGSFIRREKGGILAGEGIRQKIAGHSERKRGPVRYIRRAGAKLAYYPHLPPPKHLS